MTVMALPSLMTLTYFTTYLSFLFSLSLSFWNSSSTFQLSWFVFIIYVWNSIQKTKGLGLVGLKGLSGFSLFVYNSIWKKKKEKKKKSRELQCALFLISTRVSCWLCFRFNPQVSCVFIRVFVSFKFWGEKKLVLS